MGTIGGRPTIANTTMTAAATEYSYDIPAGTIRFSIKLRALNAILKLAFVENESGTTYISIPYGETYVEENVKGGPLTLYFQSPTALQVAEIKTWR